MYISDAFSVETTSSADRSYLFPNYPTCDTPIYKVHSKNRFGSSKMNAFVDNLDKSEIHSDRPAGLRYTTDSSPNEAANKQLLNAGSGLSSFSQFDCVVMAT
ncbi:unnamed protein product [Protopolystoma xenopodis]|uniref:Uncharacterized protein n=1 Tax=Protopolystoma xenopodis TaxID=117903 RepID=A0A3S5CUX9_9PLAT|nr:unnamed protein product [Protopolystoma xenopodis]